MSMVANDAELILQTLEKGVNYKRKEVEQAAVLPYARTLRALTRLLEQGKVGRRQLGDSIRSPYEWFLV